MASMEEKFEAATASRDLPGVVLVASDVTGKFTYENAIGPKSSAEKISLETTFIMASCTKLMTSIAALQCVERRQIGLDDDVSTVLTELKDIQILTGFKDGTEELEFKKAENMITVRQLLSHSSGIGYDGMSPLLSRWRASLGAKAAKKTDPMLQHIMVPLLFEPGTSWVYGYGLDWAGLLVMRLNNISLEAYMQKYIWDPLGIKDITFHQELKPNVKEKLVTMTKRGEKGEFYGMAAPTEEKVVWTNEKLYADPIADEFGGEGGTGSAPEYLKILKSICADDGKLLMSETIDEMFSPQLNDNAQKAFTNLAALLKEGGMFTSHNGDVKVDYGLGGALVMSDKDTGVKSGTMTWSGLPNLLWTIDRASGLSLFYASNVVPFGDLKSHEFQQLFEKEMYAMASKL